MNKLDGLVEEYLAQIERGIAELPGARRTELLGDLREHIATARAELPVETEAGIRAILDQLGDPEVIAAAAHDAADLPVSGDRRRRFRIGRAALISIAVALLALVVVAALGVAVFFLTQSSTGVAQGGQARTVATLVG
jgi:uncharacterized membrane protein